MADPRDARLTKHDREEEGQPRIRQQDVELLRSIFKGRRQPSFASAPETEPTLPDSATADLMRRYLLGDLADEERSHMEELYFTDDSAFLLLAIVEDELVDDYVAAVLSDTDRERFERNYLTSDERHRRVEFARAIVGREHGGAVVARSGLWYRIARTVCGSVNLPRWAAIMAVLFIAVMLVERWGLSREEATQLRSAERERRLLFDPSPLMSKATSSVFTTPVLQMPSDSSLFATAAGLSRTPEFVVPREAAWVLMRLAYPSEAGSSAGESTTKLQRESEENLASIRRQLAELRERYTNDHPEVKRLEGLLERLKELESTMRLHDTPYVDNTVMRAAVWKERTATVVWESTGSFVSVRDNIISALVPASVLAPDDYLLTITDGHYLLGFYSFRTTVS